MSLIPEAEMALSNATPVDDPASLHSSIEPRRQMRAVPEFLASARAAQDALHSDSQETVNELTEIIHRLVCDRSGVAAAWAETAVAETGQGDVRDKIEKTQNVVGLMYDEMKDDRSVGVLTDPADDPVEIGKPVGVVGAHTPSTNCAATPVALALTAFKGGNALIISPSPWAVETCELVVSDIQDELAAHGFPRCLIQSLSQPIRKDRTEELLTRADAIQVTGSPSQVTMGETSGTPNYCVGAGNTVGIIDSTADLTAAADYIAHSAAFDNGLVCVCMSNILVPPRRADAFTDDLAAAGGYVCSPHETSRLRETLFTDASINPDCIGQPATTIASMAGFSDELDDKEFLVPVVDDVDLDDPLVRENLSPVATLYPVPRDNVVTRANEITSHQGQGHSCTIYGDKGQVIEIAKQVDVCRIALNQSSIGLSVGEQNRVDTSLSLGCGTWGGNQTDENITYEQFINRTTLYDRVDSPSQVHASPPALETTSTASKLLHSVYSAITRRG